MAKLFKIKLNKRLYRKMNIKQAYLYFYCNLKEYFEEEHNDKALISLEEQAAILRRALKLRETK